MAQEKVLLRDELQTKLVCAIAGENLLGYQENLSKDGRGQGHDRERKD